MIDDRPTVLVTGGAGFIGSALIAALLADGHEIHVIDDLSFGDRSLVEIGDDRFHTVDVRDARAVADVVTAVDPQWLVHLAAVHFLPYCNANPVEALTVNVQGTINVLDAARRARRLEKLLFASTAAVYPICDEATSEDHPPCPTDVYGISKLTGEHLVNEFHLETGVPAVICRFFNAFGPNETNAHVIPEIQRQVNAGHRTIRLGNVAPKRDFIHTSDMAVAIQRLLTTFAEGIDVFNLGRGIEYSITEVVHAFEQQLGESISIDVDPSRMRKVERMHLLADISKLKAFIGWEPSVSLEQGIATLIDNPRGGRRPS